MTEHQDIKEFFEKNAVSYNDQKYTHFSVTTPFAWHPDRIFLQNSDDPAVQEMQNVVKTLTRHALGSRTTFFSDSIGMAMLDYRHTHREPCAETVLVAFEVLTTAGDHLVYTAKFPSSAFHSSSDVSEFAKDYAAPTSLKLVDMAIKDVKFEDALAVTAYVGEVSTLAVGGTDVPSEKRN